VSDPFDVERREYDRETFLKRAGLVGAGTLALPSILAASAGAAAADKRIAFSHPYSNNPIQQGVYRFARERAKQKGYTLLTDNAQQKLDIQVADVEAWISQKVPAMVILPVEATAMENLAVKAMKQGLLWFDFSIPMKHHTAGIYYDHYGGGLILGQAAGRWIAKHKGGKAKVAISTFNSLEVGRLRTKGMVKGVKQFAPAAKIVAMQDSGDVESGLNFATTVLEKYPDLDVYLGLNDDSAVGAYQAFDNAHVDPKTVFIGGMDSPEQALKLLRDGNGSYRATAALRLRDLGYVAVDLPKRALEGKKVQTVNVPYKLLTNANKKLLTAYLGDWKK
jgi:ABC-type sugar transport system substrate-binding protein